MGGVRWAMDDTRLEADAVPLGRRGGMPRSGLRMRAQMQAPQRVPYYMDRARAPLGPATHATFD